ncbi:ATP-binding protein (plasmid) [Burkholderia glumae]|uniref:ATP-binding protein n=1 Tax=Burkholderia glumae TaxID=337 RepID=A0ABY5BAU5_BURGL|nr:ATP-binding protein [Burkholderia glumae]USS44130.1 ATP-binding protein [Burkholderia glumae]
MTDDELRQRLADHEDQLVERKPESVKRDELRQTLSAFANTLKPAQLGVLFIGVADKSDAITGVMDSDGVQKRVRQAAEGCYPPIRSYEAHAISADGKTVVAVVISESAERPHFTGAAFVRVGSESVNASIEQFEMLIASRNSKAGAILRMRDRPVTVEAIGQRLRLRVSPSARQSMEARVEGCDAHCVRLRGQFKNSREGLFTSSASC